jgi:hypothetical protein
MHERHEAADMRRLYRTQFRLAEQAQQQLEGVCVILQRRRRKAALMPEGIEVLAG